MRKYRLSVHDGDVPDITWRHRLWRKLWCSWRGHQEPREIPVIFLDQQIRVLCGDCLEHLYSVEYRNLTTTS